MKAYLTCVDCGATVPWDLAVPVRLGGKRAYVCQSCFQSYRIQNPIHWISEYCNRKGGKYVRQVLRDGTIVHKCAYSGSRNPKGVPRVTAHRQIVIDAIVSNAKRLEQATRKPIASWQRYIFDKEQLAKEKTSVLEGINSDLRMRIFYAETYGKQNPTGGLYKAFHGNPPVARRVKIRVPDKNERLVSIGRLEAIEYQPYGNSKRKRQVFRHRLGDTGSKMLSQRPILATGANGKGLFIVEDKAKKIRFGSRGIIG